MMILRDFNYAVRLLAKKPGFTLLTILVMATGIGLSVFLFSIFNTMAFKTLPFKDGESLVQVSASQNGVRNNGMLNLHDYQEIRDSVGGLVEFSAFREVSLNVAGTDGARRYSAVEAESNIFQLTRTEPVVGRSFTDSESQQGAEPVVVLGFDVWINAYGGSASVLDETIRINGTSHRVVGVMPEGYYFPFTAEMWVPLTETARQTNRSDAGSVFGLAHIAGGSTAEEVNNALTLVMQRLEAQYPKTNTGVSAYAIGLPQIAVGDGIGVVRTMQAVAILILLLASINVGNLLLSRAVERSKETAIRVALGAPNRRIVSQMLWESIIICSIGGALGLALLSWGLSVVGPVVSSFSVDKPPFWQQFGLDAFTLKVFFSFIVATILATGLLPAWKNSNTNFNAILRDGTRGALGKKSGRLNKILVVSEIFVALTVLIAAGVMTVVNFRASSADYAANAESLLTAQIHLTESLYDSPEKKNEFIATLESRLANSGSIGDVMVSTNLPSVYADTPFVALEGREYTEEKGYPRANYISVTPGSLQNLSVDLLNGRYFDTSDNGTDKRTVIVTNGFVERHFGDADPLGQRVQIIDKSDNSPQWLNIVGVVEHTPQGATYEPRGQLPSVFRPYSQDPKNSVTIAMQMLKDKSLAVNTLRKTLESLDPDLPAFRIESYTETIGRQTNPMIFLTSVFLICGLAAVVLASSGIYGVIANTINQRTQEIGVKRALGATDGLVKKEFMGKGVKQLLIGGIPGILLGCAMGFGMSTVFPVGLADLAVVATMLTLVVSCVVLLATYYPTSRVLKLEPGAALRQD